MGLEANKREHRGRGAVTCAIVLFGFCMLFSCTSRLDISTTNSARRLVIYGTLSTEPSFVTVSISRTTGYFSGEASEMVSGASVYVTGHGEMVTLYETYQDGIYISNEPFAGVEGSTYTLSVVVDSNGDGEPELYRAASTMPPSFEIDSVKLAMSATVTDQIEVLFSATTPKAAGRYFNFVISRDFATDPDSISKYRLIEDKYFIDGDIRDVPCYYLSQKNAETKLSYGDAIGVRVDLIPGDYGRFLSQAQGEIRGAIPLFSGPPANISTNIKLVEGTADSEPLGFFGTYVSRRETAVYIPYEEIYTY